MWKPKSGLTRSGSFRRKQVVWMLPAKTAHDSAEEENTGAWPCQVIGSRKGQLSGAWNVRLFGVTDLLGDGVPDSLEAFSHELVDFGAAFHKFYESRSSAAFLSAVRSASEAVTAAASSAEGDEIFD